MANKILVVDDSASTLDAVASKLTEKGYEVIKATNGEEAIGHTDDHDFSVVVTDLMMPGVDGLSLLKHMQEHFPEVPVIVLTGYATIENAVEAMKAGAFDYLTKPVKLDEILVVVEKALEFQKLKIENLYLKDQLKKKYRFENIIGDSPQMQKIYRIVEKVADTDSTVLILGESGTGKELIAKAIHYNSSRRNRPFIPINCGAIPEELLESELFGHEKGAFTSAIKERAGRFELANGGTIFLDEIGDMSPKLQVKLLRVLQEHRFERIGGTKTIKVDIRVIAATHQDLEKAVEEGKFREDLFYRLNVIPIKIPPLRDRGSDIDLLVKHFMQTYSQRKGIKPKKITPEAMECLRRFHWPGNVRELENVIERLLILTDSEEIRPEHIPEHILNPKGDEIISVPEIPEDGLYLKKVVEEFENRLIIQALQRCNGKKNKAAELLKLNRTTLIEKLKKRKIQYQPPGQ
ncbi:MAG: sigma-54-dependent Fis family transcriptional regulator [Deltaproteobacteria bacterium]|nr:MAG: sigma-54-dependent Fis family transcriptional regulator [Deltaproteobacteria bacterium]